MREFSHLTGCMRARALLSLVVLIGILNTGCVYHRVPQSKESLFAKKIEIPGISDVGRVNEFLYRGTQPNDEGIQQLKRLGIDTIVDLRGEHPGTREKERAQVEALGMRFVTIAGNGWSPPEDDQVAEFFLLLKKSPRKKIFVHCWLGGDRTGVFVATYRIAFEGWEPQQALEEMEAFHFKGFWHPAMKKYIRQFPERLAQSPALAHFRSAGYSAGTGAAH